MFRPRFLNIVRYFLPVMTWEVKGDTDGVYLTIDDGPTPGITEWILNELDKKGVKATFFCLGKNVEMYPDLYERIIAAGHIVGNHSYSHVKGWQVSTPRYVEDVDFANQLVYSELFRPPYGRITNRQARILGERYRLVMASIVSQDYNSLVHPRKCLRNVTKFVRAGDIIVFHDSLKSYRNLRYALPRAIDHIKKMGLEFKLLEFEKEKHGE